MDRNSKEDFEASVLISCVGKLEGFMDKATADNTDDYAGSRTCNY